MDKLHNLTPQAINYGSAASETVTTVKLADAVDALGLPLGKLRRLVKEGLPTVRRADARGGRGSTTLLHLPTVRAWLAARQQPGQPTEALLLTLAGELPHVIGAALDDAARLCDGPHKHALLRTMPGVWWLVATALRDHLTEHGCPEQRDLTHADLPPALARLLDSKLKSKR